jgi:hypothetical protein
MIADQISYGHSSWPTPCSEPTQRSYSRTPAKLRNVRIAWSTARGAHPDAHDMSACSWVTPTRGSPDPDAHERLVGHPCSRVLATTLSGRDLHVSESLPDRTLLTDWCTSIRVNPILNATERALLSCSLCLFIPVLSLSWILWLWRPSQRAVRSQRTR